MNVVGIAESVSAITLVIGVGFAVVQVRQNSRQRRHEAVIELVQSFRTPQFTEALDHIAQLPPGISDADLRQRMGDRMPLVTGLGGTWEALGILVYRGDIDIALFEDFFSGPILYSWGVLRDFVMQYRNNRGQTTVFGVN